ncbi:hypothetical protein CR513_07913, partial [Mucuna pruriens]
MEALAGSTDENSCSGVADEETDPEEVQELPNSKDNHSDIADLDFEVELSKLLDQVCNQEHHIAKTKEPPVAQLATIFTVEIKSAREGRVKEEIKVNLAEKSNSKANTLSKIISANEDQTQAGVEINVPPGSDSKAAQEVKDKPNLTRTEATESSWPKQPKAEIMSTHLVPSQDQVGQTDPNPLTEKFPSPPPLELKPLSSHLKYAYLDKEQ